ncbi:FkbM family methyltransferase [Phragmitibacter flavus]|uniref:FkbM family methyltransferase n=1 Tax=Phragmitibacter flavus TaxID=2576071 RepID=A0A5R8K7W0_9BACT|nr:FkbM family methyltransferase [Phragmitibacter flavus]TLD68422.1 FkbM family methyltransferase [Phragmitibacter flavus]
MEVTNSPDRPLGVVADALLFFCRRYPWEKGRSRLVRLVDQLLPKGAYLVTAMMKQSGARLRVPRADWLSLHMFTFGDYEQDIVRFLKLAMQRPCAGRPVLVDVGANLGWITVSTLMGTEGEAIAFEPVPELKGWFEENQKLNGLEKRVRLHPVAVGEEDGEISFFFHPEQLAYSGGQPLPGSTEIKVPVHRLSSLISETQWQNAAVVKVDVEGFEREVFRGAKALFAMRRPPLVFEVNRPALEERGIRPSELVEPLREAGYTKFYSMEHCLYPPENGAFRVSNVFAGTDEHQDLIDAYGYDPEFKLRARRLMPVAPLEL